MVRIRFTVNFQEAPLGTIPLSELGTRDSFATVLNPNKGDTFFLRILLPSVTGALVVALSQR